MTDTIDIGELGETDWPALTELCRRALPLDEWTEALIRRRMEEEPNYQPAFQIGAWAGDRLVGAILGGTRGSGEGRVGAIRLVAVDAKQRRQGIGSRMLGELERRLKADGVEVARVGGTAPSYFWPGIDIRYTPAFCLFHKHGYRRFDDAVNMDVDLASRDWNTDADEARLREQGFAFRRLEPADRTEFGAWLTEWWSPPWHFEGIGTYGNDPISTFVATRDGRICAFASYNATAFPGGFGPTGTEPPLQGRGLGRILFFRCMADLKAQGHRISEVCWTGPIAFYARIVGAQMSRVFYFMEKRLEMEA